MKLIVGLGNPGKEYEKTRHNIGAELLFAFGERHHAPTFKLQKSFKAEISELRINNEKVLLAFPTTYMNLSGDAVHAIAQFYKISTQDILILHDEMDVELGKAKFTAKGGAAGHNGISSIHERFTTQEISRLRIGINRPKPPIKVEDYVLQRFTNQETELLAKRGKDFLDAIESWVSQGLTKTMNVWNGVLSDASST